LDIVSFVYRLRYTEITSFYGSDSGIRVEALLFNIDTVELDWLFSASVSGASLCVCVSVKIKAKRYHIIDVNVCEIRARISCSFGYLILRFHCCYYFCLWSVSERNYKIT